MAIKLGAQNVSKVYLGSTALSQIYLGAVPLLSAGGPATKTWAAHDGFRISNAGAGNNDRRTFDIHQFAPSLEGVGQLDYSSLVPGQAGSIMVSAANAIDDLTNTNATSAADTRTQYQGFGALYPTARAADGFNSLYDQGDNGMVYEIEVSDNAGGAWAQVMEFRTPKIYANIAALANIPLPWTELSAYSLQVQSILCRWPEFTQVEQDAMGQFLTDLETGGVLHYILDIWPLFAQDELTSRSPGRNCVDPLTLVNAPTHLPGVGWKFDAASQALETAESVSTFINQINFSDARPQISETQNKGVSWFLADADNGFMANDGDRSWYIFGGNDGVNKFYSYWESRPGDFRIRSNLYGGDSNYDGQLGLNFGEPVSLWRKDNQFRARWWTDPDESAGSNTNTLAQPSTGFAIGNQAPTTLRGIRATYSLFMVYDMTTLTNADTLTIHNAMITMMDSLGIRDGHTPKYTPPPEGVMYDFTAMTVLPENVQFTGPAGREYHDSNGDLQVAGLNEPRFDHDINNANAPLGLMIFDGEACWQDVSTIYLPPGQGQPGTLYCHYSEEITSANFESILTYQADSVQQRVALQMTSTSNVQAATVGGGTDRYLNSINPITAGQVTKSAFAFATNDVQHVKDGANQQLNTTVALPTSAATKLEFGVRDEASALNGYIKEAHLYNYRMTQADMITLTTL